MPAESKAGQADEARRALILLDRPVVVDLIELTLNHGVFAVQRASTLARTVTAASRTDAAARAPNSATMLLPRAVVG